MYVHSICSKRMIDKKAITTRTVSDSVDDVKTRPEIWSSGSQGVRSLRSNIISSRNVLERPEMRYKSGIYRIDVLEFQGVQTSHPSSS